MALTLAQLKAAVQQNVMNRSGQDNLYTLALNLGQREIAQRHPWRSLRTEVQYSIVSEQFTVTGLPFWGIVEARIKINPTYSYKLLMKRKEWVVKNFPNVQGYSTGRPYCGYYENGTFYLAPKAFGQYTLTLTGWSMPKDLVLGTDVLGMDTDLAAIAFATSYSLKSLGLAELSPVWDQQFLLSLQNAIDAEQRAFGVDWSPDDFKLTEEPTSPTPWLDPFVKA